ncbi:MAG: hypothetical protein NTV68_16830, partial [Methanomicrobiales archaeon]|nr:hypothetical protein [Methanomicrobiales archaeon]
PVRIRPSPFSCRKPVGTSEGFLFFYFSCLQGIYAVYFLSRALRALIHNPGILWETDHQNRDDG